MFNVYKNQQSRQTGSRIWWVQTLPTIWGTYMKLVTKYQISAINSCWEKCDEKCAYMFNVNKNQLSRQTRSRNLTGPKTLPTIWHTYMTLVTKYQISTNNSYWEKCDEKYLGRTEGQTDRGKTVYPSPPSGSGGIISPLKNVCMPNTSKLLFKSHTAIGFYAKTMSAHGSHLGWRLWSPDIILKVYYPRTIHAMFALNWLTGFRGEDF
jgi:hypothetical protein